MLETINCEQGQPEWFECRLGIPTASMFSAVMAKGQGKTKRSYMLKLLGERLTGDPAENFSNSNMDRGNELESMAREAYTFKTGSSVEQVGFLRSGDGNGLYGYSPDGLIAADGALEIKCKLPHTHLDVLLRDEMPTEHKHQVQGGLWISEREWCDFMSFCPGIKPFIKRIHRDEEYIKQIIGAVAEFNLELYRLELQMA
jgi:putative phage-type endonuclease